MRFEPKNVKSWKACEKTKPILAKPLVSIITETPSLINKFLLETLEGNEKLKPSNLICLGSTGDTWQQAAAKLLAKYTVTGVTETGWLECTPIPGVAVEDCIEITAADADADGKFTVIGLWGETLPDGTERVQRGNVGDYVLRSPQNYEDVWIVRRGLFDSTYQLK